MDKLFQHLSSSWVRYSDYEWRTAKDGHEYLMPTSVAKPRPYDPLQQADQLLLDALDIGLQSMHRASEDSLKEASAPLPASMGCWG